MTGAVAGFAAAVTSNYLLNRTMTFRSAVPWLRSYALFLASSLLGLFIQLSALRLLVESTGTHYTLAQLAGIVAATILNFTLSNLLAFRRSRS